MPQNSRPVCKLSVVICTHEPRRDHLSQVLGALRAQTLPLSRWELLLVDNASGVPLDWADLSWHPEGRIVTEPQLGLTPARVRGIQETNGEVILFIDDDTVASEDYLAHVLRLANEHPAVGAWGGQVRLEFETPPPDWTRKYWPCLAYKEFSTESISTSRGIDDGPRPTGAGLCVRRCVAETYADCVRKDRVRYGLDRKGPSLMSAGDTDLVLVACDLGLARALFPCLRVRHLIPPARMEEAYLLRLHEELAFSIRVLGMTRTPSITPRKTNWTWWIRCITAAALRIGRKRRFFLAYKRGEYRARKYFEEQIASPPPSTPDVVPYSS